MMSVWLEIGVLRRIKGLDEMGAGKCGILLLGVKEWL